MDFNYLAPDGCHYQSKKNYVWCGLFGFCGCYSDTLYILFFDILNKLYLAAITPDGHYFYDYEGKHQDNADLQELILHILDSKNYTEHGGSVRGSWLSEEGLELCKFLFEEK